MNEFMNKCLNRKVHAMKYIPFCILLMALTTYSAFSAEYSVYGGSHTIKASAWNTSSKYSVKNVTITGTSTNHCDWFVWNTKTATVGTIGPLITESISLSFTATYDEATANCTENISISIKVGNNNSYKRQH